ncbi:hypothetical protein OLZ31_02315 [Enterobacter asburiae]|nr:hypothetical protein [Enterobacter asburiae]
MDKPLQELASALAAQGVKSLEPAKDSGVTPEEKEWLESDESEWLSSQQKQQ